MKNKFTLGIVGVRGYVGRELLNLLAKYDSIQVSWVSSRQLAGNSLASLISNDERFAAESLDKTHYFQDLTIESLSHNDIANRDTDIIVLALPNGLAAPFVTEIESSNKCNLIIDLSADYRFDSDWIYSVPELVDKRKFQIERGKIIKISNPGCYATAMQIAIAPLVSHITGSAHCFGISGYSGAGTTPSKNNDPDNLRENILPYGLLEHLHEREVSYHLQIPISFSPHVAEFFRGINMTVQLELTTAWTNKNIFTLFDDFYQDHSNIEISEEIPNLKQVVFGDRCRVGGFKLSENGKRLSYVSCLDNLLKGAASQALQNIELVMNKTM